MASTAQDLKQSILCLQDSTDGHVRDNGNKVTPIYVSPHPVDRAWAVDTLSILWDD